jgi:hypothetical protein
VAENELLDVANAKRWGETRRDLRAGMEPDVIAERAVEELNRGLSNTLAAANREGETLESLVRSLGLGNAGTREAIRRFNDPMLARMIVGAARLLPGCDQPHILARNVTTLIIDRVRDALLLQAVGTDRYRAENERQSLSEALADKFELYRPKLSLSISASLQGLPTKRSFRPRVSRAAKQLRVRAVLDQSLVANVSRQSDAQQRH